MPTSRQKTEFELTAKDKTKAALKTAENNFLKLDGVVGKLGSSFAALAGVSAIGALITSQVRGAKQALAYADALGVSVESLTAWQFAGKSVGLEADKIADIMKDSAEKIGDAYRNNAGEAKEALESLNLPIADMAKLSPDKQLLAIAGALDQVGTQGEKVQILESLGNDASLLIPLLADNARELERLIDLSDETGNTLTRIEADKLQEVSKASTELSASFEGLKQTATVNLAPALSALIKQFAIGLPAAIKIGEVALDGFWLATGAREHASEIAQQEQLSKQLLTVTRALVEQSAKLKSLEDDGASQTVLDYIEKQIQDKRTKINQLQESLSALDDDPKESKTESGGKKKNQEVVIPEDLKNRFAELDESLKSEEQRLAESHLIRQQLINDAESAGIESIISYQDLRLQLAEQFEGKLLAVVLKRDEAERKEAARAEEKLLRDIEREERRQQALEERELAGLERRLGSLVESLRSEEEALYASLASQQLIADEAFENKLVTEEEHLGILLGINSEFEDQMTALTVKGLTDREKFQKLSSKNQTKQVLGALVNLTSGVAQHSKSMFRLNKIAGIAQATINTYEGVSETLSAYPQPLASAMAAVHLAAGLAQVSAIKSTSFGGGSGAPSLAGSGGGSSTVNTVPVNPQQSSPQQSAQPTEVIIRVAGDGILKDWMIESIEEAIDDDEFSKEITILNG